MLLILTPPVVVPLPATSAKEARCSTVECDHNARFCGADALQIARAEERHHMLTVCAHRLRGRRTGHAGMAERFEMCSSALVSELSMSVGRASRRGTGRRRATGRRLGHVTKYLLPEEVHTL